MRRHACLVQDGSEANGFSFDGIDAGSLNSAFDRAVKYYNEKPEWWAELVRQNMQVRAAGALRCGCCALWAAIVGRQAARWGRVAGAGAGREGRGLWLRLHPQTAD